jgi:oxaloacetate decarboxylase alpha subunit
MAWQRAPVDVMRLALRCVIRNGIRRVWVAESMNDVETDLRIARIAKDEGADEVLVGLVYSISPLHTDAYYASRAREIAASADVDVLNLKDPGGLLTPERVATLVPALLEAAPSLPLEVHSHCTATMAPLVYLEAARLGASFVCTAARPLANGTSQPSAEQTLANLRAAGFEVPLDELALAEMSAYFTALAARIGRAVGTPAEYDVSIYRHQLPGGMTSTLRRQLREVGQEDRWDDVLAEIPRVREDLGWPIMVTPLSQFVGVQAFLNVTTGARYSQIPDEVVKYVLGQYGPPPGPLDPDLAATVLDSPKAEQFRADDSRLDLAEARARYGDAISDELLLLRMMLPAEQVDAMLARPRSCTATPGRHPVVELVEGLTQRPLREIDLRAPGVRVRAR